MNNKQIWIILIFVLMGAFLFGAGANAQEPTLQANLGTGFTYQGQLKSSGSAYTGTCDFQFGLWDDMSAGTQKGITQTVSSVSVTDGLFTTVLNSGNEFGTTAFDGNARWLAIAVRCPAGSGSYTALAPRQALTATPYALTAMKTAYKNVLVVAKNGGHYNTISAALDSITDASNTNRYLVWIAPGVYTEKVTMKSFVDLEGAGELTTKITYTASASPNTGTVVGANNAELRFLTVENTGAQANAIAIYNSSASPRLTHVTATATGATNANYAIRNESSSPIMSDMAISANASPSSYGIYNAASSPTMTNITIVASGATGQNVGVANFASSSATMTNVNITVSGGTTNCSGVYNNSSSPIMTNVTATATAGTDCHGVYNYTSASPTMTNVTANASGGMNSYGVRNYSSSSPTMIGVIATGAWGSGNNYGIYNLLSSSPTMMNVTATGTGGGNSFGVYNVSSSSPLMTNVTATASGATYNFGVRNDSASAPTMKYVTATGSGGTTSYGMYNSSSSVTIHNSIISASGGVNNFGIDTTAVSGTYTVTVNNSQIMGSTYTVRSNTGFTARIGASKLEGGAVFAIGAAVCAGVYDENYSFYASTCPSS